MSCRIERVDSGDGRIVFLVSGRIEWEHMKAIAELVGDEVRPIALDLAEITLVARNVVSLLAMWELNGVELRNCPAFLRDWIIRSRPESY